MLLMHVLVTNWPKFDPQHTRIFLFLEWQGGAEWVLKCSTVTTSYDYSVYLLIPADNQWQGLWYGPDRDRTHNLLVSVWTLHRWSSEHRRVSQNLTLICLFSSRSLCTSICSRLHSSMIFLTSPSSSEALADLGSAECSVLTEEAEKDTVLLLSLSCCGEMEGGRGCRGGGMERHADTWQGVRWAAPTVTHHQVSTVWWWRWHVDIGVRYKSQLKHARKMSGSYYIFFLAMHEKRKTFDKDLMRGMQQMIIIII